MHDETTTAAPIMIDCEGRSIAVRQEPGGEPAIIWLGGFKSDMSSTKAAALTAWAQREGAASVLFDYSGHGISGGRFEDGTITNWLADSLAVIRQFGGAAPILIGSSMGGWIAILAARLLRQERSMPSALVLIAPAVDFTETLMWQKFPPFIREMIEREGFWSRDSQYSPDPTPVTKALIEDGRKHMLLDRIFEIGCPVHILQGMKDPDVPWQHAVTLTEHLPHDTVTLTLINDGDHRLSRDEDIERLIRTVAAARMQAVSALSGR